MQTKNANSFAFPFMLSLLGIAFAAWNVFAQETTICLTEACAIFNNVSFFGISLWIYGFSVFLIFAILILFRKAYLAYCLCTLCIIGDIVLLFVMMLTAPCFNCLVIALLFACTFLAFYKSIHHRMKISPLIFIWLVFFLINVGAMSKNIVSPFPIYTASQASENVNKASMRIYFSPSCSACLELVSKLGSQEITEQANIAWFPVTENENDIYIIETLFDSISQGQSLDFAMKNTQALAIDMKNELSFKQIYLLPLQFKLLVNQAHILNAGSTRIPFVEYTGMPAHLRTTPALDALQNMDSPNHNSSIYGVTGFCDEATKLAGIPCD